MLKRYLLKYFEKYGSFVSGLTITMILNYLKFRPTYIDIFADKLFNVGLFMFGLCLTLFAIIHQGDNEKLRELKKYGSINRVNAFCFRIIVEALLLCLVCFYILDQDKLSVPQNEVLLLCWFGLILVIDASIFLRIFYQIFHYKIE